MNVSPDLVARYRSFIRDEDKLTHVIHFIESCSGGAVLDHHSSKVALMSRRSRMSIKWCLIGDQRVFLRADILK